MTDEPIQIARVVHFVLPGSSGTNSYPSTPQCRPALVVNNFQNGAPNATVNLLVFPDGDNDRRYDHYGVTPHSHKVAGVKDEDGEVAVTGVPLQAVVQGVIPVWETRVVAANVVKVERSWHWPKLCDHLEIPPPPEMIEGSRAYHNHGAGLVDPHNCYACRRLADVASKVGSA